MSMGAEIEVSEMIHMKIELEIDHLLLLQSHFNLISKPSNEGERLVALFTWISKNVVDEWIEASYRSNMNSVEVIVEAQLKSCLKGLPLIVTNEGQNEHSNCVSPPVASEQPFSLFTEETVDIEDFFNALNAKLHDKSDIDVSKDHRKNVAINTLTTHNTNESLVDSIPGEIALRFEEINGEFSNNQHYKNRVPIETLEVQQITTFQGEDKDEFNFKVFGGFTEEKVDSTNGEWHVSSGTSSIIKTEGDNVDYGLIVQNRKANLLNISTLPTTPNVEPKMKKNSKNCGEIVTNERKSLSKNMYNHVTEQLHHSEILPHIINKKKSIEKKSMCSEKLECESNALEDALNNHINVDFYDCTMETDSSHSIYECKSASPFCKKTLVAGLLNTDVEYLGTNHQFRLPSFASEIMINTYKKNIATSTTTLEKHINRNTCPICNKTFAQKLNLKVHMRFHIGEKLFPCTSCNKRFTQLSFLNLHMRTHTCEKLFTCKICNKGFSQLSSLKVHMMVHTVKKTIACNICNKRFLRMISLKRHARIHTGEMLNTCNICNKSFTQMCHLKEHIRVHTGEKPFTCIICNKGFSKKGNLKKHITFHSVEKSNI